MYGSWLYCSKNIHWKTSANFLPVFGQKFRSFGEIREDGVGFRENKAVVVEHRCAAVGIDLEKFCGAAFAFQNIDFDDFTGNTELTEQQANFVGIAGVGDVVEFHNDWGQAVQVVQRSEGFRNRAIGTRCQRSVNVLNALNWLNVFYRIKAAVLVSRNHHTGP